MVAFPSVSYILIARRRRRRQRRVNGPPASAVYLYVGIVSQLQLATLHLRFMITNVFADMLLVFRVRGDLTLYKRRFFTIAGPRESPRRIVVQNKLITLLNNK